MGPEWYRKGEVTKRRRSRLQKSELRKTLRPYVLDAEWLYESEVQLILRGLARFIDKRGWAPTAEYFAKSRKWDEKALRRYLNDLRESGLVRMLPAHGWMPTEAGFAAVNLVPVAPRYSTQLHARRAARRRERDVAGALECHARALAES